MIRAQIYAVLAAVGLFLLALLKAVTMQRDAAREDAKRAKKHVTEIQDIRKAEKAINAETKQVKEKAVEDIKNGKMPDNIRNPNDF